MSSSHAASAIPGPGGPAWRWVSLLRILMLLAAAGALAGAAATSLHARDAGPAGVVYACPMHPQVTSKEPGHHCPICHMALEPVHRGASPAAADPVAVQNLVPHNVIDAVRWRSLLFNTSELRGAARVEGDGTVTALFYDDQLEAIAPGAAGTFTFTQDPGAPVAVHRTDDPPVRLDDSTSWIRFRAAGDLRPGRAGWIELPRKPRRVLGVPVSAILESPEGPYVVVPVGGGRFQRRPVKIGETFAGLGVAAVVSGLRMQDRIISREAFFVDAERKLDAPSGSTPGGAP